MAPLPDPAPQVTSILDWIAGNYPEVAKKIDHISWAGPGTYYFVALKNNLTFQVQKWQDIPAVIATNPQPPPAIKPSSPYYGGTGVKWPDPELEKLLAEEEAIEAKLHKPVHEDTEFKIYSGEEPYHALERMLGPIAEYQCVCPHKVYAGKHGHQKACKTHSSLWQMVQHLNDTHRWSRERIADWMESLDIDLTIAYKLTCEWCGKAYHGLNREPPTICSPECGEKLANVLLENPELQEMPENKRALWIQAYRELTEMEVNSNVGDNPGPTN